MFEKKCEAQTPSNTYNICHCIQHWKREEIRKNDGYIVRHYIKKKKYIIHFTLYIKYN